MAHRPHAEIEPQLEVRSEALRHGSMVVLSLDHLDPCEQVTLRASAMETDDVVWHDAQVDERGRLDTAVMLPIADKPAQEWTFALASTERDLEVTTQPVLVMPKL